jgi:hypothetical protein
MDPAAPESKVDLPASVEGFVWAHSSVRAGPLHDVHQRQGRENHGNRADFEYAAGRRGQAWREPTTRQSCGSMMPIAIAMPYRRRPMRPESGGCGNLSGLETAMGADVLCAHQISELNRTVRSPATMRLRLRQRRASRARTVIMAERPHAARHLHIVDPYLVSSSGT